MARGVSRPERWRRRWRGPLVFCSYLPDAPQRRLFLEPARVVGLLAGRRVQGRVDLRRRGSPAGGRGLERCQLTHLADAAQGRRRFFRGLQRLLGPAGSLQRRPDLGADEHASMQGEGALQGRAGT